MVIWNSGISLIVSCNRKWNEVNATRDALVDHRVANCLRHDDGSESKEGTMIKPKRNDVAGCLLSREVWFTMRKADAPLIGYR